MSLVCTCPPPLPHPCTEYVLSMYWVRTSTNSVRPEYVCDMCLFWDLLYRFSRSAAWCKHAGARCPATTCRSGQWQRWSLPRGWRIFWQTRCIWLCGMGVSAVQGCDACKMLSLQSAKEALDKRLKEASDGRKDDGAWNEVWVGFVWVCTRTNIVRTFDPKYVLSTYYFPAGIFFFP